MANPITYKPLPVDPQQELMRRVESAPREHAEALLAAWDLLQASHEKGVLDLAQGLIGGRDIIAGKLAEAANSADGINAVRNMIALGRIIAALDPEMLYKFSRALDRQAPRVQDKPPSLLSLLRQFRGEDSRRGLAYALDMLAAVGAATRE
ncbi:MAG TPA: DUF1641 domain-containing protein [Acidobacteriaceae bacterium]|jgi:uncharacterized protein YjgD (DUF1641 family)|nr:DUF1641 domain-containing protein [Acidobacteriaceae bacterium]